MAVVNAARQLDPVKEARAQSVRRARKSKKIKGIDLSTYTSVGDGKSLQIVKPVYTPLLYQQSTVAPSFDTPQTST